MKLFQSVLWFVSATTWTGTSIIMGIKGNLAAIIAIIIVVLCSLLLGQMIIKKQN